MTEFESLRENLDWDEIRFFLAVARSGSLSAAARHLGVTQPTVGRRIRMLEAKLDTQLFERLNHDHILSRVGKSILGIAEAIERDIVDIERRVGGKDQSLTGRLRLSTAECFGTYWLVPRLPLFKRRYPGVQVELKLSLNALDIMRGECDIAMSLGNPTSEELVGRRVGEVQFGLYGNLKYLEDHGAPETLEQLVIHRILDTAGDLASLPHAQRLRQKSSGAEVPFLSNSQSALFAAAQAGMGLLALPVYVARRVPGLKRVLIDDFDLRRHVWLVTHRELRDMARVRAMLDFLAEEFRLDQDLLSESKSRRGGKDVSSP